MFLFCLLLSLFSTLLWAQNWSITSQSSGVQRIHCVPVAKSDSVMLFAGQIYLLDLHKKTMQEKPIAPYKYILMGTMLSDSVCIVVSDSLIAMNIYTGKHLRAAEYKYGFMPDSTSYMLQRSESEVAIVKIDEYGTNVYFYDYKKNEHWMRTFYNFNSQGHHISFYDINRNRPITSGKSYWEKGYNDTLYLRDLRNDALLWKRHFKEYVNPFYGSRCLVTDSVRIVVEADSTLRFRNLFTDSVCYSYRCPDVNQTFLYSPDNVIFSSADGKTFFISTGCSTKILESSTWKELGSYNFKVLGNYSYVYDYDPIIFLSKDAQQFWISEHFDLLLSTCPTNNGNALSAFTIIDTKSGDVKARFPDNACNGIDAASYSGDGKTIALAMRYPNANGNNSAWSNSYVDMLDAANGKLLRPSIFSSYYFSGMCLSPTGDTLYCVADSSLYMLSTRNDSIFHVMPERRSLYSSYTPPLLSVDGKTLVICSDSTIRVRSAQTAALKYTLTAEGKYKRFLGCSLPINGNEIIALEYGSILKRYALYNGSLFSTIMCDSIKPGSLSWSDTGHRFASSTWVYDSYSGRCIYKHPDTLKGNEYYTSMLSADGNYLLVQKHDLNNNNAGDWIRISDGSVRCECNDYLLAQTADGKEFISYHYENGAQNPSTEIHSVHTFGNLSLCSEITLGISEQELSSAKPEKGLCFSPSFIPLTSFFSNNYELENGLLWQSTVQVFSVDGRQLLQLDEATKDSLLNLSSFGEGVYYAVFRNGQKVCTRYFTVVP